MIRLILVIVIGVLALSYLGISLRGIVESPAGQQNIHFVWQLVQDGWQHLMGLFTNLSAQRA